MHCAICDQPMDDFRVDPRDGSAVPCSTCLNIINETVAGYDKEDDEIEDVAYIETSLEEYKDLYEG